MAPVAFPHKSSLEDGYHEGFDSQYTTHYAPTHSNYQPISFFDSINSVLHVTKSTDASHNGSQTGSGHGLQNTPSGQGESEEESDLAVLLALFIPLAATVTAIFIIALFVRRMRRAESLQDVHHTGDDATEFEMTPRKKLSVRTSTRSTVSSVSSTYSQYQPTSLSSIHVKDSRSSSSLSNTTKSHAPLDKSSSSASIYCNSSYLRLSNPHHPLSYQRSLPASTTSGVSHSPSGGGSPAPWPLTQESGSKLYTRSHYGLNKLQQELYQQATLRAFSSMQSLNGLTRQYSDPQTYCNTPRSDIDLSSDECSNKSSSGASDTPSKKQSSKKIKRVLSAINFPRKIRQYQADRKRFNIYTIPTETREQLKHIYVY